MIPLRRALLLALLVVAAQPAWAQVPVATGVSEEATEVASQPKIARDATGGVHLTFVKPSGGFDQIHVASSADGGRTWRVQQVTTRPVHSRYPTLAAGPDGGLHLAWTTYEPIGHVYYARFDGQRWSAARKISPGAEYAGVPAIAVDPTGKAHVAWYGIREQTPQVPTRHGSIYEIIYTGLAEGRWSRPIVISPGIPDAINPALAVDGSGTLHSAWYQFDARVYQAQYARRERAWASPHQVSAGQTDVFAVALAVHPDGRAYLVWERRAEPVTRVYFAERRERWSGQQSISPEGQSALQPTVAVDARDRVYVVWQSDGRLYQRRRDGRWQGVERLTAEGGSTHPILAARGETVDLMWTEAVAGAHQVRFATLAGASARSGGPTGWAALILILLVAMLLWQWRRLARVTRG